jgi:hypothetical protein
MAAGTEKGIFEFDVPAASFTISLAGRTYGTLVLSSATNGNAVTYSGNGANSLHINGDLQINPGTRFSIGMSADMIVQGKLILSASSEINLQNSTNNNLVKIAGDINADGTITETNSGLPVLELNGTKMQNVSVSGSVVNNVSFRVNNPAGTTLTTPLTLPYKLELMTGKIRTNEINILSLADNAIVTGGSTVSFVDGPMKKIGDDNFTFPVGKGSIYAPVGYISTGLATTDVFQAEYFRSSPQSIYGINYQAPPIHHVSYAEYWSLNKITGNLNIPAKITLTVNEYSFATDINTLLVARFDGVDKQWKSDNLDTKTPGIYNPPYVTGTLTSDPVSSFGIFTLATSVPEAINPLPIKLISFSVEKISDHKSIISWRLADCVSDHVRFELQRSVNANEFITIKNMTGRITDHYYTFIDDQPPRGLKNYRLRITNEDGKISFSKVVALPDSQRGLLVNIYPNPVSDKSVIEIHSDTVEQIRFVLHDVSGRMVKAWNERIHAGMTLLHLSVVDIGKGIYFLSVLNSKAETTTPFIKQ